MLIRRHIHLRCVRDGSVPQASRQPIEREVHDGSGEEGQGLAENQAADDRDAQRPAEFGARPATQGQRQAAQHGCHGGHQNGPEAQQTCLIDCIQRSFSAFAFGFERKVDHHDGVFLHDTDQQDDSDESDYAEIDFCNQQGQKRANAGGGQRRENRDWMNITLIEHAQNDIHRQQRGEDQDRLVRQRRLESRRGALKPRMDAGRQPDYPAVPA